MTIYTRMGAEVKILELVAGEHKPKGFEYPLTLVKAELSGDKQKWNKYCFAQFLIADEGQTEIARAVGQAPVVTLDGKTLAKAIRAAL